MNIVRCCYHSRILHFGTSRFWRNFQWQEVNHLYPLQICTQGQRFYYWQLAVSKWKTDEPLLVRWPSCQHVATRIPGGAGLLPAATGGDLDLHWICFSPRALFVPCMSYSRLMVAQSRSRTLSSSQRFGKIQPVFTPARRGGKAERTKAVRWFLWTVATLSSLWQPFPSTTDQPLTPVFAPSSREPHERATCGAQLLFVPHIFHQLGHDWNIAENTPVTTVRKRSTWYHTNWKLLS